MNGEIIWWCVGETRFGLMLVAARHEGLCWASFGHDHNALFKAHPKAELREQQTPLLSQALAAMDNPELAAALPVACAGTAFQRRVWDELRRIPPGETRSYLDIARALGDPNATRAVGTANGANPVAIIVPCHRVVRSDGSLGGYTGGLERKRALLAAETKVVQGSLPLSS